MNLPSMRKNLLTLLLFIIAIVVSLCFYGNNIVGGHDSIFHYWRLVGIATNLDYSFFNPPAIYGAHLNGAGYGAGLFYCDFFLYPFAALNTLGIPAHYCYNLYTSTIFWTAALTAYLAGKNITNNHHVGIYFAIAYTLGHYHITNLCTRSALGELQAMVFIPLLFWGLYNWTEERMSKPWILVLAFSGLLVSHAISVFVAMICFFAWGMLRINKLISDTGWILSGIKSVVILFLLTSFFWTPLLEQITSNNFWYETFTSPLQARCLSANDFLTEFYNITQFQFNTFNLGILALILFTFTLISARVRQKLTLKHQAYFTKICIISLITAGIMLSIGAYTVIKDLTTAGLGAIYSFLFFYMGSGLSYLFAVTVSIFLICVFTIEGKNKNTCKSALLLIIISLALVHSFYNIGIWAWIETWWASNIQFAWRLSIIAQPAIYLALAALMAKIQKCRRIILFIFSVIFIAMGYFSYGNGEKQAKIENFQQASFWTQCGWGREWLPANASFKKIIQRSNAITELCHNSTQQGEHRNCNEFTFRHAGGSAQYLTPKVWYKGYAAHLKKADGSILELNTRVGEDDLVLVELDSSTPEGEICIFYKGTTIQKASKLISLISFCILLLHFIRNRRKQSSKSH